MRRALVVAATLAACGARSVPVALVASPRLPPPAQPTPVALDAPDPPTAEDTAAIAELLSAPPVVAEHTPRFAPDGRHVAFVSNRDGTNALYLAQVDGSAPARRVAEVPLRFRRPCVPLDQRMSTTCTLRYGAARRLRSGPSVV